MNSEERKIKNVLVIGRGAVGISLFKDMVKSLPKENCGFLCGPVRKERYEKEGLTVNGETETLPLITPEQIEQPADLILFAVKSTGLKAAMELAAPFVKKGTILVSAINGIKSEEELSKRFEDAVVIRAVPQKMDAVYTGSSITFESRGELVFGAQDEGQKEAVQKLADLFDRGNVPFKISKDIVKDQYSKLMFNCGINQVCAAYKATYGMVDGQKDLHALFMQAMGEALAVFQAMNIPLTVRDLNMWEQALSRLEPDAMPSMAQDILAGRKTELDLFSGTLIPLAKECGVEVPVLKDLAGRILHLERLQLRRNLEL